MTKSVLQLNLLKAPDIIIYHEEMPTENNQPTFHWVNVDAREPLYNYIHDCASELYPKGITACTILRNAVVFHIGQHVYTVGSIVVL